MVTAYLIEYLTTTQRLIRKGCLPILIPAMALIMGIKIDKKPWLVVNLWVVVKYSIR
jgi:hypothetical protein